MTTERRIGMVISPVLVTAPVFAADALGVIIAHELGHLLLPDAGHSATGLMQSSYSLGNSSARRFTPAEADAIRQRLAFEQFR